MLLHLPASLADAFSAVAQMRLLLNSLAMWWPFAWSECVCLPMVLFLLWIPAPRSHGVPVVVASTSKAGRRWSLAEQHARSMHDLTQRSWPWLLEASIPMALWIVRLCSSPHTASGQLLACQTQRVQTRVFVPIDARSSQASHHEHQLTVAWMFWRHVLSFDVLLQRHAHVFPSFTKAHSVHC